MPALLRNICRRAPRSTVTSIRCYSKPAALSRTRTGVFSSVSSDADEEEDDKSLAALARHMEEGYDILMPYNPRKKGVGHIPVRVVPSRIKAPRYLTDPSAYDPAPEDGDGRIPLGGIEERSLREAAVLGKMALAFAGGLVEVGRTTDEIDARLHDFIISHDAYPSPLKYHGFPKACCTSVNNVVAHGIPDSRPLHDGDIVNIDVTVFLNGFHGDTSRTFLVGEVDARGRELVQASEEAVEAGIGACAPGKPFKAIGAAIQDYITMHQTGMSISRQFTGHGIGTIFHRSPSIIPHVNEEPGVMLPGHCFTIEPCIVDDEDSRGWMWPDGWTVSTETGARSAQAEHMVLITENGADVLTR